MKSRGLATSTDPPTGGCRGNKGRNIRGRLEPPEDFSKGNELMAITKEPQKIPRSRRRYLALIALCSLTVRIDGEENHHIYRPNANEHF